MKILVVADEESTYLWDHYRPGMLKDYSMILSAGDLKASYLSFLVTMANRPLLYVHGNHDASYAYRPPEGCFSEQNLKFASECGYQTIFWSYAYADWDNNKQLPPEKALAKLKGHTHNGEVLLLHPTSATNVAILDQYLTYLTEEGFRFGTLYELTGQG